MVSVECDRGVSFEDKIMRSQQEIMQKIDGVSKMLYKLDPKKDPFYQQYKILCHKLDWINAKNFLAPEDYTPENELEWNKLNCLDKKVLITEIKEQVDLGAMHVCGGDMELSLHCATGLIAQFWLLGPSKDKILTAIFQDFLKHENIMNCCEHTFISVASELGFNWTRMKLCYQGGMFSRLADKYGKNFKLKQDQEIMQAMQETIEEKASGQLAIEKDKEERKSI